MNFNSVIFKRLKFKGQFQSHLNRKVRESKKAHHFVYSLAKEEGFVVSSKYFLGIIKTGHRPRKCKGNQNSHSF